jgi:DNA-directed RNA polymerase subunit alpha
MTSLSLSIINSLKIEEIKAPEKANTSNFVFNHLPLGMGVTLGNYLRRNIISNLSGVAPIGVRVADKQGFVKSKFSSLEGCSETTPYLVINLKNIIFSSLKELGDKVTTLHLKVENNQDEERKLVAGDFAANDYLQIQNPDLYLTTLAPQATIEIVLYCKNDFGYHRGDDRKNELEEEVISLDSDHSPIRGKGIALRVESVITNLSTEEDRLTLTVETNGSVSPRQALLAVIDNSLEVFGYLKNSLSNSED